MRYVAAALLTALGGNDVSAGNIKKILSAVGIEAEDDKVDIVVSNLAGKSIEEIIAEGSTKLGSMPGGGGGAAEAAPAAKEEEKKEESEEEEDDDMGFGLFDYNLDYCHQNCRLASQKLLNIFKT